MPQALAVIALVAAHFIDYTSFLLMVGRHGLAAELNPIVIHMVHELGLAGLTVAKFAVVAFAALLMIIVAKRHPRFGMALLVFGTLAGAVGGMTNIATL